jgi:hypothetical protein
MCPWTAVVYSALASLYGMNVTEELRRFSISTGDTVTMLCVAKNSSYCTSGVYNHILDSSFKKASLRRLRERFLWDNT